MSRNKPGARPCLLRFYDENSPYHGEKTKIFEFGVFRVCLHGLHGLHDIKPPPQDRRTTGPQDRRTAGFTMFLKSIDQTKDCLVNIPGGFANWGRFSHMACLKIVRGQH